MAPRNTERFEPEPMAGPEPEPMIPESRVPIIMADARMDYAQELYEVWLEHAGNPARQAEEIRRRLRLAAGIDVEPDDGKGPRGPHSHG